MTILDFLANWINLIFCWFYFREFFFHFSPIFGSCVSHKIERYFSSVFISIELSYARYDYAGFFSFFCFFCFWVLPLAIGSQIIRSS